MEYFILFSELISQEPSSSNMALFSILSLPTEEALTLTDTLSRLTPSRSVNTPGSIHSELIREPSTSSTQFVQPTYEPLSDDED